MGVIRRLDEEEVLHDDEVHGREARRHMLGVGVGLENVLALHVETLEGAVDRRVEHVRDAQAGLGIELDPPFLLEGLARGLVRDVLIARQLMREGAHVAGALHIVLTAQRVHADAAPAEIAGRHREIGDAHDRRRALAVLGDAEAVVDRAVAARGVETRRGAQLRRRNAGVFLGRLGTVALLGDEGRPVLILVLVAALAHEFFVHEPFGDDHMRHRRHDGDIRAGLQRQMMGGCDVRRAHEVDLARIDDDELCAFAQPRLHARAEDRVRVGRIGADHDDHVGLVDRVRNLACRPRCRTPGSTRIPSGNGTRARKCRYCCCRSPRERASGRDSSPHSCSARK